MTPAAQPRIDLAEHAQFVAPGGSQAFTFTADAGYHLTDVKVDGVSDAAAVTSGCVHLHQRPGRHRASRHFLRVTNYTITPTAGANGSISPATPQTVAVRRSMTFTVTPNAGYQVDAAYR